MPTFHVENFGCRATQADGAAIERQFETRGLARANSAEADLVILNTCTVTNSADQDARAAVRRVQRQNPLARIIVTGCYAQRAPDEIAALRGVTAVIGNSHKHELAEIALSDSMRLLSEPGSAGVAEAQRSSRAKSVPSLEEDSARKTAAFVPIGTLTAGSRKPEAGFSEALLYVTDIFAHTELLAAPVFECATEANENSRTRPNLKVQDGCDNRCSFCVIPIVRGRSRSLQLPKIIQEVNALVAGGYRELVISGINLGRWGRDLETGIRHPASGERDRDRGAIFTTPEARSRKPLFEALLRAILDETRLEKLRISSVEPMDWTDSLIALVASSPRIAKHAHVPLQSGSDAVLRRMHRKYRPWHYREKIEKIHAAMPTAAIGADVMAGFPGETDAEFEATRRLIADLPLTYLHVFTYSARPGTPAAAMPDQVPVRVARERNKILRDLAAEKKKRFMQSFVGKTLQSITLNTSRNSSDGASHACNAEPLATEHHREESGQDRLVCTEALTDNYQKLYLKGLHAPNRWITAQIDRITDGAFVGSLAMAY